MPYHFLIVEDQPMIAIEIEDAIMELGHYSLGIASNKNDALALARYADIAFVDVNLTDGATGIEVGERLARENNVEVIFMTSDTRLLDDEVPGTVGAITKPVHNSELAETIRFAVDRLETGDGQPPKRMRTFH